MRQIVIIAEVPAILFDEFLASIPANETTALGNLVYKVRVDTDPAQNALVELATKSSINASEDKMQLELFS